MTPDELNITYECLMMINTSLELIVREAKKLKDTCRNPVIYPTEVIAKALKIANEIIAMADSIERRKEPLFKLIEEQRKSHDNARCVCPKCGQSHDPKLINGGAAKKS